MKNILTTLVLVAMAFVFIQCGDEADPFLIQKDAVGPLAKNTAMKKVDSIFANDSIVKLNPNENALGTQGEVEVYDTDGTKLLLLSPEDENDPSAHITNIQIFDSRYKTEKGLNIKSTFGDLKANYEIAGIENAINSVVVFLKDSNIYVTIDKKQLPENIRYDYQAKIEQSQIPNEATFKYFMVGWDTDYDAPEPLE
ncbi:hypothetical protein [Altibacter sp. HG106]|uniref:hypothetical protein n=1 Tax=Altibacter sp. HG106 TaxID=3023937 RepID=UPI0023509E70|nr:hypothetical protein [Altibacter sp. HG106]MDC7996056.1 hypothetical protein [Altibacter sp. HG106]